MAKTNYTVARVQTRTKDSIGKYERHNERKNEHYANMNVDLSQTEKNVHFKSCGNLTYNETLDQVVADGKSQTQRIDLSDMFANSGYYLFSFNNLFSKEMSIPVTFTLYNAEGEQMSNAATYSIESYANSKGSGTDKLAKLTQALMCFGDAASAYFA